MTWPATSPSACRRSTKHLPVLLDAGLVTKEKHGRTTSVRLVPGSLEELGIWAMSTRLMWSNALHRLSAALEEER